MRNLLAIFISLVGCAAAYAEDTPKLLAVVDMQRVLDESVAGKAARSNIEAEAKKSEAKLTQLKADFEKESADLQKRSALLSGQALEEKRGQLIKRQRDFERAVQDAREDLAHKNDAQMSKVVREVDGVVKEIASQNKYTFVLEKDRTVVLYADPRLEFTDEVIKLLDDKKISF